jgi:long-chain acyl-CoA synthetase
MLGATVHYLPRFTPLTVTKMIEEKQVSIFVAVASMYGALCKMKSAGPEIMKSVNLLISGGEPLPMTVAGDFEARFGVKLMEGYGMTESSPVVSVNVPWDFKMGSVGKPLPGVGVKAVDESGATLPAGQDGELVVTGHGVMAGYYNKPELTARAIRDGELYTGDVGHLDEDGFIFITGRAKEMMIIGGENVYPREIESALETHPAVAESAVIGVRDDIRGELPVAFVILTEGATVSENELADHCRKSLANFKVPRKFHFADDLPRGATGKILKRALNEQLKQND